MAGISARGIFRVLNRGFMVPAFRLGLGPLMGNPITGYIMVVKTTGRRTGLTRYTPVNYALLDGLVYCIAGWGRASDWYRNLQANPEVEVILPGRTIAGVAEEVDDPEEGRRAMRRVMKNSGWAAFAAGINPFTISDDALREKTNDARLLRVRPTSVPFVAPGPADPGGWSWLGVVALAVWLLRRRGRAARG